MKYMHVSSLYVISITKMWESHKCHQIKYWMLEKVLGSREQSSPIEILIYSQPQIKII